MSQASRPKLPDQPEVSAAIQRLQISNELFAVRKPYCMTVCSPKTGDTAIPPVSLAFHGMGVVDARRRNLPQVFPHSRNS